MLRALKALVLVALALALATVALANRAPVTLHLLPAEAAEFLGFAPELTVPLFVLAFAGVLVGLLIGFVWEWLREHKIRRTASTASRKLAALEGEMAKIQAKSAPQDDVLALLEKR